MTAVTGVTLVAPAETVAASLCWLARFKVRQHFHGDRGTDRIGSQVDQFWHNKPCRFCTIDMDTLIAAVNASNAAMTEEQRRSFERLDRSAKTAKVREAQEESWLDELTRAG